MANPNKLRRINNVLSVLVILLGLYLVLSPYVPDLLFPFHHKTLTPYSGKLQSYYENNSAKSPVPRDNRLVIPGIDFNERVLEGKNISVINHNGIWRRPSTSNDPNAGNMVIIGHRFLYNNPYGSFYHLNKVKVGTKLGLYWDGREHVYQVTETKVVSPDDFNIEVRTDQPQLTLYTCTPLLSAKDRLVVVAREVKS